MAEQQTSRCFGQPEIAFPFQGLHSEAQCCLILQRSVQREGVSASRGNEGRLITDLDGKDPNNLLNGGNGC